MINSKFNSTVIAQKGELQSLPLFPLVWIQRPPVMPGAFRVLGRAKRTLRARFPTPRTGLTGLYPPEVSGVEPHRLLGNTIVGLSGRGRGN